MDAPSTERADTTPTPGAGGADSGGDHRSGGHHHHYPSDDQRGQYGDQHQQQREYSQTGSAADESRQMPEGAPSTKLYIGSLSERANEDDLRELFGRYGELRRVDVKEGFGFVEYQDQKDAETARHALDRYELKGRSIKVEFSLDRKRQPGQGRCFNCNQEGHWAKECPRTRAPDRGYDRRSPPRSSRYDAPRAYSPRRTSPPRSSGAYDSYGYGRSGGGAYPPSSSYSSSRRSPPRGSSGYDAYGGYSRSSAYAPSSYGSGSGSGSGYRDYREPRDRDYSSSTGGAYASGGAYSSSRRSPPRYPPAGSAPYRDDRDRDYYGRSAAPPPAADPYYGRDYRAPPPGDYRGSSGYGSRDTGRRY